jgi:RNA processing factor Prp31
MLKKTLLSYGDFNDGKILLINVLGKIQNKSDKWKANKIVFDKENNLNRVQDSVIKITIKKIREKNLVVTKPSRKTTILNVEFNHYNEEFAKIFNEKLVANVNEFYIKSKSFKTGINLNVLQKESDSVRNVLNNSIQILAALDESIPKLNPLLKTLKTPYQKAMVDVQANTAIFQELVKQLELAKV